MEPEDVLGHQVGDFAVPVFVAVVGVDCCEVVAQCFDPDIDPVRIISRHLDAPVRVAFFDLSADGDLHESLLESTKHFVLARAREDVHRVVCELFFEPALVVVEAEEVVLLHALFEGFACDW